MNYMNRMGITITTVIVPYNNFICDNFYLLCGVDKKVKKCFTLTGKLKR